MNKRIILGATLISLLAIFLFICSCGDGGGDTASQAESAATTEDTAPVEAAAEETAEIVAAHDCAGGCGMTAMPEDQMTEIDGKWYCAGCAKNIQSAEEGPGEG